MIYRSFLHLAIAGNSTSQFRSGLISLLHHLQRLIKLAQHMIELEVYAAGVRDPNKSSNWITNSRRPRLALQGR
jgi:hypothetical protein